MLDSCLLTDEEMRAYEATKGDENLRKLFFPAK